jgi:hypothetical protein
VAAHAAAAWQSKPYYTWTDAELKEVLNDSAWASNGTITYYVPPGRNARGGGFGAIEETATVSWVSSLPLRQAGVRQQMAGPLPAGQTPPKEVSDALAQPAQAYVIAIKLSDGPTRSEAASFAGGTAVMQPETFLLRDGKEPIKAIQSEGKVIDKDGKIVETPAAPRGGGGGGGPRGAAPANGPFFDLQRGGGGFGGGGGLGAGAGNRARGMSSMLVYVFPKTDAISAADKEVEFSSKLCTAAFGGFGGGGGGAPRGGAPANAPFLDIQRGGGGGGIGGGGFGAPGGGAAATPPSATSTCRYGVKKKFKLKDMVFNGELAL